MTDELTENAVRVLERIDGFSGRAFRNGDPSATLRGLADAGMVRLSREILALTGLHTGGWFVTITDDGRRALAGWRISREARTAGEE